MSEIQNSNGQVLGTVASTRIVNESAIRQHALECSKRFRNGKFTRVGEDFINEVTIDVENLVRQLKSSNPAVLYDPLPPEGTFTTGALMDKVQANLNDLIGRIIQNKVRKQTTGCTLSSTR